MGFKSKISWPRTAKGMVGRAICRLHGGAAVSRGGDNDGNNDPSSSEGKTDDENDNNLDCTRGDGVRLPDHLDVMRGWSDGADGVPVDGPMRNWSEVLHVLDDGETWVSGRRSAAAAAVAAERAASAAASETSSAVYAEHNGSVRSSSTTSNSCSRTSSWRTHSVDACRLAESTVHAGSRVQDWPKPLRIILTGTAGTVKIVVINVMALSLIHI